MSEAYKNAMISDLKLELEQAREINVEDIANEILAIGFECLICGKCCRREEGDNTVIVSPVEIKIIQDSRFIRPENISSPLLEENMGIFDLSSLEKYVASIDKQGNVHTFGWRLCQKKNGDCKFIQGKGERCTIYDVRPMMCSTYPFYMENMELKTSICEGIGREISYVQSRELAKMIIQRYLAEIQDTILLYTNYHEFNRSNDALDKALTNLSNGYINYVIHDSKGEHIIKQTIKMSKSSIDL
jgi:Fe-S-cluster containining protein